MGGEEEEDEVLKEFDAVYRRMTGREPPCILYTMDDEGNPVPCPNILKWGRWMEKMRLTEKLPGKPVPNGLHVAWDEVGECHISTVFLGSPACDNTMNTLGSDDMGFFFETMVFGPDDVIEYLSKSSGEDDTSIFSKVFGGIDFQRRYRTIGEAREGHAAVLSHVRAMLAARN